MAQGSANLTFHEGSVSRERREEILGQRGCALWLTGLSGSGKSTLARALELELTGRGRLAYVLDGDNVRHGLNSDLGFSDRDREENIRRIGEVAALFVDAGVLVITAFISPFRADRDRVRAIVSAERFLEVFVDAPLEVCEERDPKGLYRKARKNEIEQFTGISSPYEPPLDPALAIRTSNTSVAEGVSMMVELLDRRGILGTIAKRGNPLR